MCHSRMSKLRSRPWSHSHTATVRRCSACHPNCRSASTCSRSPRRCSAVCPWRSPTLPPNREVILIPPKMEVVARGGIRQLASLMPIDFRVVRPVRQDPGRQHRDDPARCASSVGHPGGNAPSGEAAVHRTKKTVRERKKEEGRRKARWQFWDALLRSTIGDRLPSSFSFFLICDR